MRCELDAVISENCVDPAGHGLDQAQLALLGTHLGNVDVEVADRIALELLLVRLVAFDIR